MWSAVVVSVTDGDLAHRVPAGPPGTTTAAAAASENSACATICCGVHPGAGGCMCRLVSSTQSSSAGRPRAATKSAAAPSPGSAA